MAELKPYFDLLEFKSFNVATLRVESKALLGNPLGDSPIRSCPLLVPKGEIPKSGWPVVFLLSGFAGNGSKAFNDKGFEKNFAQVIDEQVSRNKAPLAIYFFVDGWTKWGGSQFVNSAAMGNYEDYVACDLVAAVKESFEVDESSSKWAICGGSSGGYGALQIASKYPKIFSHAGAIAPDSFFEASLLPDIYKALPAIHKMGGLQEVKNSLEEGHLLNSRSGFSVLNAIAMCRCYLPADTKEGFEFPVDIDTGLIIEEKWKTIKDHDPIHFMVNRKESVEKLESIYIDVGIFDQYQLQFGARQLRSILRPLKVELVYSEFEGSHSDISKRHPELLEWLDKRWSK